MKVETMRKAWCGYGNEAHTPAPLMTGMTPAVQFDESHADSQPLSPAPLPWIWVVASMRSS